jgi:hypothetical protein
MQRAAASAVANPSSSKGLDAKTRVADGYDEPQTPSHKRQRLSSSNNRSPISPIPAQHPSSDLQAISAALEAQERKRAEAVALQAAEAGETQWVLNFPSAPAADLNNPGANEPWILEAGSLDVEDEDLDSGRRSYGNFKRKKKSTEVCSLSHCSVRTVSVPRKTHALNKNFPSTSV